MPKTMLFPVKEVVLIGNGFTKEFHEDKNHHNDKINTIRFEYYTKQISDEIRIEVGYTFLTSDGKTYKHTESTVELHVCDSWTAIPITKLSDLLSLIIILKGND